MADALEVGTSYPVQLYALYIVLISLVAYNYKSNTEWLWDEHTSPGELQRVAGALICVAVSPVFSEQKSML